MVAGDIPRARAAACLLPPLFCRLRTIASRSRASIWVSLRRVTERHSGGKLGADNAQSLAGNGFGQNPLQLRDIWDHVVF